MQMGKMEESIDTFEQLYKLTDDPLKGVTWLGFAYAKAGVMFLNVHPGFKDIRKDPRFKQLLKKIGLDN